MKFYSRWGIYEVDDERCDAQNEYQDHLQEKFTS